MSWTRRRFLAALGAGAVATACRGGGDDATPTTTTTTPPTPSTLAPVDHGEPVGAYPFGLGVASGDPDDTSVVLWTWVDRPRAVPVTVEVARDEDFRAVVQRGDVLADPAAGMTVRLIARPLEADTTYWYRFVLDGHRTPAARTRTAPAPGAVPAGPLRVGQLSCQRYSSGYWTALDDVAEQAPDLVVHCGDYVYESDHGAVRPVDAPAPTDLEGYRALWRRYKAEPELQAAHAVAPWLVVWDDHEVEDNYQGDTPGGAPAPPGADHAAFRARRAAAYRAWWEFTPTRVRPPDGDRLTLHRTVDWGGLTRFVLLDTRQHRDDQLCTTDGGLGPDAGARCEDTATVTMLGEDQQAWFDEVATDHAAVWTTVVQQVVLHQWRLLTGNVVWNLDQWDGYTGARTRLLDTLRTSPSPVVLTGDVHSSWVADLRTDFDDESSPTVGVEFVTPGVSSAVPDVLRQAGSFVERLSPHVAWSDTEHRGWVLHELTPDTWTATYRLVADATVPGSSVSTASSWTVEADARGLA